jgi:hypothetical protein
MGRFSIKNRIFLHFPRYAKFGVASEILMKIYLFLLMQIIKSLQ